MCLFENLTTEVQNWRCEKATQYQQPCWSEGRRLFAFGFHTAAETVEDSSRAEELESFLGVIHSQEACLLNFVSTCDYGFSWKSSTTSIRCCSIAVFVNHVSDTSPRLIPFQSDQRPPSCIGLFACLPFFCLPWVPSLVWILSIRDLNSSQLLDVEPLINLLCLVGFSVNASSERLNMGEIETLDDYWVPAAVPALPPA